jgi:hypothetical protein
VKKHILIAIFLGIFFTLQIEASVISFYVIETGLQTEGTGNRNSVLWENAFLDVFFDSGYIVSNYPMMRLSSKPEGSIIEASGFDADEAKDAGIDFILVTQLDYDNALLPPSVITFYIFRVSNHQVIYEKRIAGIAERPEKDAYESMKTIIKELVQFVTNL